MSNLKGTSVASLKMMAKYADATLLCLRSHESTTSKSLSIKFIVEWVGKATGLNQEEWIRLTKGGTKRTADRAIQWSFQVLKTKHLIETDCYQKRGYLQLTSRGRTSRYTHDDFVTALIVLSAEKKAAKKQTLLKISPPECPLLHRMTKKDVTPRPQARGIL